VRTDATLARGIHMSASDIVKVRSAMHVLLSGPTFDSLDAWRSAVLRETVTLLGADSAMFMLRSADGQGSMVVQDIPRIDEYIPRTNEFEPRIRLWDRQLTHVVWSRAMLWGRLLPDMKTSTYYNEFIRAVRGFDTVGLTVPIGESGELANLNWAHATERGIPFGDRGLALIALIEPAFRAGVAMALTSHSDGDGRTVFPTTASAARAPGRIELEQLLPTLTERERTVVELLARRRTNHEIAETLGIAPGTAKRHVENILRKIGLRSRRDIEPILDRDF